MSQKEIEVILTRQLASYLAMPVLLVDTEGNLIFYNEAAESLLRCCFQETGVMPLSEWSTMFTPADDQGNPIPPEALPLVTAVTRQRPCHGNFSIQTMDGGWRHIESTAFPLIGQADRFLGAVSLFWEAPRK